MGHTRPPLTTVQRTFEVIEVLRSADGAGPTEVADRMGLAKSTVHEYLRALKESGFVIQKEGKYYVSHKFLTVGGRLQTDNRLVRVAKPELRTLARETGLRVNYSIEERSKNIILHQEVGEEALRILSYPGMETALHSHAGGKVLLAHLPEEKIEHVLENDLIPFTKETITDPAVMREELRQIREQGYAVDWDEQAQGMGMAAVPVLFEGELHGAISVVCPSDSLENQDFQDELLLKMRERLNTITVNYQYGANEQIKDRLGGV